MNVLSATLTKLASVLGVLSIVLAAPATYEILPQAPTMPAVGEVGHSTPTRNPLPPNATQGEIRQRIAQISRDSGISQVLALAIAECESQFKNVPNFKYDGENGRYTAWGIFQITKSTAEHTGLNLDRKNIEENIVMGIHLLKTDGIRHWNESKTCWLEKI